MTLRLTAALSLLVLAAACTTHGFPQQEYDDAYMLIVADAYIPAAERFAELSRSNPRYPEIWYNLGICLMETARYAEAEAALLKAADLYENAAMYDDKAGLRYDAMTTIGEVRLLQGDFAGAEEQFDRCLAERSDRAAINAVVAAYIRRGFTDKAERFFAERNIDVWM